jgi:hypothetical protein
LTLVSFYDILLFRIRVLNVIEDKMLTHKVPEFFGDIIEVERVNTDINSFSSTHYGGIPWSQTDPQFASIAEKYEVYKDGRHAKRTEPYPAHCELGRYRRFFVIKKFKAVTTAPSDSKPERRSK